MVAHAARESSVIPWFVVPALQVDPLSADLPTVLAIVGATAAMGLARHRARRAGLSIRRTIDGFALILLCGLLFGHIFDVLLYRFAEFQADWRIILPWFGGFCSVGAFVGLAIAIFAVFRAPGDGLRWDYLDQLSPGVLLGLGIFRVGCFIGHHHAGQLSGFVFAVAYPGGSRHDLGLYEALLAFALFIALHALEKRVRFQPGFVAMAATCGYCIGRLGIEFLRGSDIEILGRHSDPRYAGLTLVQYAALFGVVASLLWILRRRWGWRGSGMGDSLK
jgi:phosphatidylglycerol---prolipoprotein diacylglyceryl transferase